MDEQGRKEFRVELAQAEAWLEATRPDDYARWDRALENADLDYDQPAESRLERDLVARWRGRQDDQLPDPVRGRAEMAQAEAWLRVIDPDRYRDWSQAHLLALTPAEHDQDHRHILRLWRDHAGNAESDVHGHSGAEAALRRARERRVAVAAAWFRDNDPDRYRDWKTRRGFADSIGDESGGDVALVRMWLTRLAEPLPVKKAPAPPRSPLQRLTRHMLQRPLPDRSSGDAIEL